MKIKGRPHLEVLRADSDPNLVSITATCECGTVTEFHADAVAFQDWARGKGFVQDIPRLTDSRREMILSGTCDPCWDKLFKFDDFDDEDGDDEPEGDDSLRGGFDGNDDGKLS